MFFKFISASYCRLFFRIYNQWRKNWRHYKIKDWRKTWRECTFLIGLIIDWDNQLQPYFITYSCFVSFKSPVLN